MNSYINLYLNWCWNNFHLSLLINQHISLFIWIILTNVIFTALDTLFIKNPQQINQLQVEHGKCVDFYVVVKINFIMLFLVKRCNNRESLSVDSWMFYLFFNNFLESFSNWWANNKHHRVHLLHFFPKHFSYLILCL